MRRFIQRIQQFSRGRNLTEILCGIGGRLRLACSSRDNFIDRIIKPLIPGEAVVMNGVVIRRAHLLSENQNDPYHEEGLVASIKEWVQSNDTVVLVGGGKGISTVVAAEQVGSEGFVIVYEPVMNNVETINSVVELNDVANQVEVVHAYVAVTIDTFGDPIGADHIEPAALPKCDTLILDCEGAESDILKEMRIHPSKLIVESHGIYDSPPEYIENLLEDRGYRIKDKKLAISSDERRDFCKENGIYVIVAVKDGPSPKLD